MRVVRATPPAHAISAEGRPLTDESGVVRGDRYNLPTWAEFEFGTSPVLWEPKQPKAPEASPKAPEAAPKKASPQ